MMLDTLLLKGKCGRRLISLVLPLSAALALSFLLGGQLQNHAGLYWNLQSVLLFLAIWLLCFFLLCHLFETVPVWLARGKTIRQISNRALFLSTFCIFCLIACVWILAFFPMLLNYDIDEHLMQIAYHNYHTHQPLVYTLLLQGLLLISSSLGLTDTWSFLMLGLFQIAVMGLTMSYALVSFNRSGNGRRMMVFAAAYYCLFPLFGYFAVSATKDGLFACFLTLTAVELYRMVSGSKSRWSVFRLILFALLMCQLRYNGLLTLILFTGLTLVFGLVHRFRAPYRRLAIVLPLIILLHFGFTQALVLITNAATPSTVKRDVLSLPLQQMVRALQTAQDEQDIAAIERFFATDDILAYYSPAIADPVKNQLLDPDENFTSVLKT